MNLLFPYISRLLFSKVISTWLSLAVACIFLFTAGVQAVRAQLILQVVSQKVSSSFEYVEGQVLHIETERADIQIEATQGNEVQLELQLIAKHRNRELAEEAIKQFGYQAERIGRDIYLKNSLPSNTNAYLKAVFVIRMPERGALNLKNRLGNVRISGLHSDMVAEGYLCMFELENLSGTLQLHSNLGNVFASHIRAETHMRVERARLEMEHIRGDVHLTGIYAELQLDGSTHSKEQPLHIDIQVDKSDIELRNFPTAFHQYKLDVRHGNLHLEKWPDMQLSENGLSAQLLPAESRGRIAVSTTYGNIVLR